MAPLSTSKKPFHIAICGGGIGGLCMAIGLLHQNISCTVYEAAPAFAEIGAGVSFGPNAIWAMSLIDPDIIKGFNKIATRNASPENKDVWFEFSLGVQDEGWKDRKAPGKENQNVAITIAEGVGHCSVHRAHFLDVLVALVPDSVAKFGKKVTNVEEQDDRVLLTFEDGSTAEADAVIGCDGVKSRTRQVLLGKDHPATNPTFTGTYAYRGLIPMEKAVKAVGHELAANSHMYMGHHAHVLTFPIEQGKTMNVVAFHTKASGKWDDERWVLPMKKEDMLADFESWGDKVQQILALMEKSDVWALFDHPPAPTYYRGRFAILGDAAHASTPHQGAGAGQAIEDAFVLSNLLGQISSTESIEKAFRAYDSVRRPRSQKVVTTSIEAGKLYDFEDDLLGSDLDRIKKNLETRYNWIWNEDMLAQLKRAEDIMGLETHFKAASVD